MKKKVSISALMATFALTTGVNAQTAASISQKFSDSLTAKASEASLTTIVNQYVNVAQDEEGGVAMQKKIIALYPQGDMAAIGGLMETFKKAQEGVVTKEDLLSLKTKYPKVSFEDRKTTPGQYYVYVLAASFAPILEKDSVYAVNELLPKLDASSLNSVAFNYFQQNKHTALAEKMSKSSLEKLKAAYSKLDQYPETDRKKYVASLDQQYAAYEDTYAQLLDLKGDAKSAIPYEEDAVAKMQVQDPSVNSVYIKFLLHDKQYQKVVDKGSEFYKTGAADSTVSSYIKEAYEKLHPKADATAYMATLEAQHKAAQNEELRKKMINEPAFNFTLKDIDGKTVSLKDYLGKVVVLDFWATWCGPCKASFPGMQLAVNKYKNDKDVVFLFINTWERSTPEKRLAEINKEIKGKNYDFHVLLDASEKGKGKFDAVEAYGIQGIPAKFIIGKDGNVKFKMEGYSGSSDAVLKEVSSVIDVLKK